MKRLFWLLLLTILLLAQVAYGAGTCTQATTKATNGNQITVTFTCTADSVAASYPDTAIATNTMAYLSGWYLDMVEINPGSTAPTANYDVYLLNANGTDILGGAGENRSATANETVVPRKSTSVALYGGMFHDGTLTLRISNNLVNSAVTVIKCIFTR